MTSMDNEVVSTNTTPPKASLKSKLSKVWFWATCWRPVTKYEAAKLAQMTFSLYSQEAKARIATDNQIIQHINGQDEAEANEYKNDIAFE